MSSETTRDVESVEGEAAEQLICVGRRLINRKASGAVGLTDALRCRAPAIV